MKELIPKISLTGVEILKECVSRPLDAIFVCCGGGGMLAGIAAYVKRVRPSTKIIGVESEDAAGSLTILDNELKVTDSYSFDCYTINRHDYVASRGKGCHS